MGADTSRFTKGIGNAGTALKGFLAGAVAGFSTSALKEVISDISEIGKKASRVGLTTDALQELRYAGELTGVATKSMDIGMQRFARRIAEVANGAENDLGKVLKANNITLRDGDGRLRSQSDILGDYAELIKNVGSEQDRTRLAFLAFDSEGVAMVNTLKNGRDGLEGMREEARKLGIVISEDMVRAAEELDDKFTRATARMGAVWKKFVVSVVTGVDGIVRDIEEFKTTLNDLADPGLIRRLGLLQINLENARKYGNQKDVAAVQLEIEALKELILQRERAAEKKFGSGSFASPTVVPQKENGDAKKARIAREKLVRDSAKASAAEARAIEQVIGALQLEYDNFSRTSQQQRIYNELKRAGVDASSEAGQAIAGLITMIDAESAALERADEQMELLAARQREMHDQAADMIDVGFGIGEAFAESGKRGEQAILQLIKQLVLAAAKAAILNAITGGSSFNTAGGGDAWQGLRARTFSAGGYTGDGGVNEIAGLTHGREFVVKASATARHRKMLESINAGGMVGGGTGGGNYAPVYNIDARGADAGVEKKITDALISYDKNVAPGRVINTMKRFSQSGGSL